MHTDPSAPMTGGLELQRAKALHRAGRLYELIGVKPGASRGELKAACRAAQLRAHPDKGGNGDYFKLIDAAVQLLLNDIPRFHGHPPTQAADLMTMIEHRRHEIDIWEARLVGLQSSLSQATDREKAAAQRSLTVTGRLLEGTVRDLTSLREEYLKLHSEHVQEQEEREAKVAAAPAAVISPSTVRNRRQNFTS